MADDHQEDAAAAADSVDWRKSGAVGRIKNQKETCVCWAFAAIAAIESINYIHTKRMISFSEQYLIDCDNEFNKGFAIGQVKKAFKFILKYGGGVPSEEDYPFLGQKGTCNVKGKIAMGKIHGYDRVTPSCNEKVLMEAVRKQPVTAEIDYAWIKGLGPSKEIFRYKRCKIECNHVVLIVGFGTENGVDYWIIKNSKGEEWGDGGYLRIERNVSDPKGTLGIASRCYYPRKKGVNM